MILDLKRLKEILEDKVLSVYDHRLLNREVEPFDRVVPTVENIAIDIWNRLASAHRRGAPRLYSVRVHETSELVGRIPGRGMTVQLDQALRFRRLAPAAFARA